MNKQIRRRCKCGCNKITRSGNKYINGHSSFGNKHGKINKGRKFSDTHKKNIALSKIGNTYGSGNKGKKHSEKTKLKISLSKQNMKFSDTHKKNISLSSIGNTNGRGNKDRRHSEKTKLKISLMKLKCNPNSKYCDVWKDKEYKNDLRKNYCENKNCKNISKKLDNHHIYLDKKRCAPWEIMTLCNSCHAWLHHKLKNSKRISADPKDFIIINRPDHVSYIRKATRQIIRINKNLPKNNKKVYNKL